MDVRLCKAAANGFVQIYSNDDILEQLKRLYSLRIICVIEEIDKLLPSYRTAVDRHTYERNRAKVMLVAAYLSEGEMGAHALALSLNFLQKQQKLFADALEQGG